MARNEWFDEECGRLFRESENENEMEIQGNLEKYTMDVLAGCGVKWWNE